MTSLPVVRLFRTGYRKHEMPNTSSKLSSAAIRTICAVEILGSQQEKVQLGRVTQIVRTAELISCGPGFNESTVKVRAGHKLYFVFRADLEPTSWCKEAEKESGYVSANSKPGAEATDNTGQIIRSELAKRSREAVPVSSELSLL